MTTLDAHLEADRRPGAAEVGALVRAVAAAGVKIADELARAVLIGQLGTTGETNVQGEQVKKLDVWANDVMVAALEATGRACSLVSEEMEEIRHNAAQCADGRYIVCFDPVDGSSNLDVNGIVGTIFSVLKRAGGDGHPQSDVLQPGRTQVAAGYIMYGPSSLLIMTTGAGVHGFTLDRAKGAWVRTHADLRMPARGRTYSINDGNFARWPDSVRDFVEHARQIDPASGRPYTARYAGSLVMDVHRILLEGGIFLYPEDAAGRGKQTTGKLRLMYEASPMGWVIEQAGGAASTGRARILDLVPTSPHQRVPLLIGSREDVQRAEEFYAGKPA
jgi:fructose-1,6-bisphosphatase I